MSLVNPAFQGPLNDVSALGWLGEVRTLANVARMSVAMCLPRAVRAARPQPVMVLPGFGGDDRWTWPLRRTLDAAGHQAEGWVSAATWPAWTSATPRTTFRQWDCSGPASIRDGNVPSRDVSRPNRSAACSRRCCRPRVGTHPARPCTSLPAARIGSCRPTSWCAWPTRTGPHHHASGVLDAPARLMPGLTRPAMTPAAHEELLDALVGLGSPPAVFLVGARHRVTSGRETLWKISIAL